MTTRRHRQATPAPADNGPPQPGLDGAPLAPDPDPAILEAIASPPAALLEQLNADIAAAGGEQTPDPAFVGAIGATMFDLPSSADNSVTVLLPRGTVQDAPAQSLVRIRSRRDGDGRSYLAVVEAGPFAEPDTLRADSHLLVTVNTQGGIFLPSYHGRIQVKILGEELADGTLVPPRWRPLPNSPVVALPAAEAARVLKAEGDIRLGLATGHGELTVNVPSRSKGVLPRHTAILGTTGGGKSTTVAGLVQQAQAAGMSVILLDVEGEYSHLHEPTTDPKMLTALETRGLKPGGIPARQTTLYHLTGRDCANPGHPQRREFSLQFARLSPYAVCEILELSEAQQVRFFKAYELTRELMRDLGIFPAKNNAEQERLALEVDEFERGYPRLTLSLLLDVVSACLTQAEKSRDEGEDEADGAATFTPYNEVLKTKEGLRALRTRLHTMQLPKAPVSWKSLLGKLWRLHRLKVFYNEANGVRPVEYRPMLRPGQVSLIDLSDTGASELNNLVIADLLHGIHDAQDEAYQAAEVARAAGNEANCPRVLVIIEEAHEFLGSERIDKMRILFEQVARIAKRGRKRWLGLCFVTQLPQHLPRQLLGLVNNFVLHKITDPQVVNTLRHTISGIDEALWQRLPGLTPGQAIVSFGHLTRPLLAAIDPTPARLRLAEE